MIRDLPAIMKGIIEEARKVDLDKPEKDIEEEGNGIALKKYESFAGHRAPTPLRVERIDHTIPETEMQLRLKSHPPRGPHLQTTDPIYLDLLKGLFP